MAGVLGKRRGELASLAWFCAHGVGLLVLTFVTAAQGLVFWITGSALAVSNFAGQGLLNRWAGRSAAGWAGKTGAAPQPPPEGGRNGGPP